MQALPISESDIVSIDNIAEGVHGLRILFVNVFGLANSDGSWTLIDAGLPFSAERIRRWAEERFHSKPQAIVLTHGHFDHVGAAKTLAESWDIPVYAHELELPFLTGRESYPPPDPTVGGGMMAIMSPLYPRDPIDISERVRTLSADGIIPELSDWRWLHTPGHTLGHVSLFRERDRALLVGDAFCTTKAESMMAIARQKPELSGPPAYYTPNWDDAKRSVQKLAELRPNILAPGHGAPMVGADIPQRLSELAARFDEIARPEHGRYVDRPGESAA